MTAAKLEEFFGLTPVKLEELFSATKAAAFRNLCLVEIVERLLWQEIDQGSTELANLHELVRSLLEVSGDLSDMIEHRRVNHSQEHWVEPELRAPLPRAG